MSTEAITQSLIESQVTPAAEPSEELATNPETTLETQPDSDLAQRLAILARKEKSLLQKQQEMAQKFKEMEERANKFKEWEEKDKLFSENPLEFIKQKGLSFEQVQQKMLESMQDDDLDPIQKQLKELRAELSKKDESYKKLLEETLGERDRKAKDAELEQQSQYYNAELKKHIEQKAEEYDLIRTFGAEDEVFNVIKSVYLKTAEAGTPKLMTFDEACGLYEKKLEELVQGMTKSKKVSKLFGGSSDEDPFAKVFGQTTLDDSFGQSSTTSHDITSEEARMKAAMKLFEQQINTP